ncbi:MAG TPA: hypothetical protein PLP42_02790 [Acidobacteriota bacterium]|nr:hypothetical protein [Acidobacteriota bacterium]
MKESLDYLPVSVMNLASEDLLLWKDLSQTRFKSTTIISTNLTPRDKNLPAPPPYAVVEVPGTSLGLRKNVRIGFLGLVSPDLLKPNSPFTAADPLAAVARIKGEVMKKADFLIVLAEVNKPTAIRLAQAHPEIYGIMMVERAFIEHTPEQVNNAVLVWSIERGRYLGQLVLELNERGQIEVFKPERVILDSNVAEDQTLLRRQNEIKAKVPAGAGH